ncbi:MULTISPECIES: helix-turn-helix transcriptional regulator [Actinokineospora]|uniref:Transcriptional regulator n=1 Tax=Actinokineospora fastidiosa TaxID=1816 RepID=A0A918G8G5_9PSEU|nr:MULTISPECIES: TrmB family transcriptional regulator [Actinokineospora]UVS82045.1 putative transcriptional regulator [Actinokineospora sp. UTMC 2448]GGS23911.1 transcriptional regulator [Actinokineospora fastidiosa]
MSDGDLAPHLSRLGLPDDEIHAYQYLLRTGPSTAEEIAAGIGRPQPGVRVAVRALTDAGLVGTGGPHGTVFTPVPPASGLEILSRRRASELEQARVATLNAYDTFRRAVSPQRTDDLIEVVTGTAIAQRIQQMELSARTEIRRLESPPYFTEGHVNNAELEQLARGEVTYRVVYARASVEDPARYANNIQPCVAAGEQARVLPEVPVKLTIVDQQFATVSLPVAEADVNRSLLVVHPSSLLSALVGLFEASWRLAVPLQAGAHAVSPVQPIEQRLLGLLAAGANDDSIARQLGISRRTVFRHLQRLMEHAGATSRFQLAVHAVRHRWI